VAIDPHNARRGGGRRVDEAFPALDTSMVPDCIEPAKSGRASCRGCARNIARGELRFGESLPNLFAEGETRVWFHLACAACMRPEKLGPVLEMGGQSLPEQEWLQHTIAMGLAHPRLQRLLHAERAPSGVAHCRQCRELIAKGSWRLALQMFEEGRMRPIGTIHMQCTSAYFGTADILDRIARLTEGLSPTELADIGQHCR
jgi:hypothetical protein